MAGIRVYFGTPDNGGDDITAFHIQWKSGAQDWSTTRQVTAASSPHEITGLSEDTTYDIRVRAANSVGNGQWSDEIQATATSDLDIRSDTVRVYFGEPGDGGSPLTAYIVQWRSGNQSWNTGRQRILGSDARFYDVENLTTGETHYFRVRARNAIGLGAWSREIRVLLGIVLVEGPPIPQDPREGPPVEGPPVEVEGDPVEGPPIPVPPLEGAPVEGSPIPQAPREGSPIPQPSREGSPIPVPPTDHPPREGPPVPQSPREGAPVEGAPIPVPPTPNPPTSGYVPNPASPSGRTFRTNIPVPPTHHPPREGAPVEGAPIPVPPVEGAPIPVPPTPNPPLEGAPVSVPPLEGSPIPVPAREGPPVEGSPIPQAPREGPPVEGPPVEVEGDPVEGPPIPVPPIEGPPVPAT